MLNGFSFTKKFWVDFQAEKIAKQNKPKKIINIRIFDFDNMRKYIFTAGLFVPNSQSL